MCQGAPAGLTHGQPGLDKAEVVNSKDGVMDSMDDVVYSNIYGDMPLYP